MDLDPTTTKYEITAELTAEGVVEKPDVIGAIFGQTEGLLGDELDLRDLQKSGRIGRIEVTVDSKGGKTTGEVTLPSSLDRVETAILAAALESIDRIGPCKAIVSVTDIDDVRVSKRGQVIERAKELLQEIAGEGRDASGELIDEVTESVRIEELVSYGSERLPAGPNVSSSESIIVVEGRNDVANLLKNGIKNAIASEGTSIPETIRTLSNEKVVTAFVDGDRGGELLLKELLQVSEVDFVARAPHAREVEELTQKQIMKALRNKLPSEQYIQETGFKPEVEEREKKARSEPDREDQSEKDEDRGKKDEDRGKKGEDRGKQKEEREKKRDEDRGRQKRDRKRKPRDRRSRDRGDSREKRETAPPATAGSGELATFREQLDGLSGKLQGVLLDESGKVVKGPLAVRDLADTLKQEGGNVKSVVFDGVITQRILDIAVDKKIGTLVGVKKGNITNEPDVVEVLTRDDL